MNYAFNAFGTVTQEPETNTKKGERILLPCGEYHFTVREVIFEDFKGSRKLPACPACILALALDTESGEVKTIKDKLYSCEEMEWKVRQLFNSVYPNGGRRPKNLAQLVGRSGWLRLAHGTGTSKSGKTYAIEQVKEYLSEEPQ